MVGYVSKTNVNLQFTIESASIECSSVRRVMWSQIELRREVQFHADNKYASKEQNGAFNKATARALRAEVKNIKAYTSDKRKNVSVQHCQCIGFLAVNKGRS